MAQVTVRKRGSTWEYRLELASINGRRQQRSKAGFRTKADALRAGREVMAQYEQSGIVCCTSDISYADHLDHWMDAYCKTELSAVTCAGYEKRIRNHIKPVLGHYTLAALSTEAIQKFLTDKYHAGISRNSLLSLKGIISGSLNYAVRISKQISSNPAQDTRIPSSRTKPKKTPAKIKRSYITPDQMNQILQRFPYGNSCHLPLLFAYRCGLRLGEAFAVFWEDIDFEKETLFVQRQVQYIEGKITFCSPKYNSERTIRLDSYMVHLLRKVYEDQQYNRTYYAEFYQHHYETPDRQLSTGTAPSECHEIFPVNTREDGSFIQPRVMMHAGRIIHHQLHIPEYNYHSLRHSHATMLAEQGALPKDIQNRLGHKNIDVTMQIYVHLTKEMEDVSVRILDAMPIPVTDKPDDEA